MSWPVCHTPPRIVTHQVAVESPKRATSHARSRARTTPRRPARRQSSASPTTARPELTAGCQLIAACGPTAATRGRSTNAGNGANGT